MQADGKGRTLWEMFLQRIHHGNNGSGVPFYNPLDLRVGAAMPVAYSNGPEFQGYDFTVREIREFNRHLGGKDYRFTDYVLRGVNNKSFDANDTIEAKIRAVPNTAGAHDALLLRLEDEFAFAETFLAVVQDDTGVFEITDDASGAQTTLTRINDLRESYLAAVLAVAATTPDGKAVAGQFSPLQIEYWDYWREVALGGGGTAREFLFVEMNRDNGWFQLWRGREFYT